MLRSLGEEKVAATQRIQQLEEHLRRDADEVSVSYWAAFCSTHRWAASSQMKKIQEEYAGIKAKHRAEKARSEEQAKADRAVRPRLSFLTALAIFIHLSRVLFAATGGVDAASAAAAAGAPEPHSHHQVQSPLRPVRS